MSKNQEVFRRYEKKYLLNSVQYKLFTEAVKDEFKTDKYGMCTISNIYFDTPDYKLIRESLDKPVYKEKLRLRTYEIPDADSTAFIELKKKYKGIVYKRRVDMSYLKAFDYLYHNKEIENPAQIQKEIDYFISFHNNISPAMFISYDRIAAYGVNNPDLRITFDSNITWRNNNLELTEGVWGNALLSSDKVLMEIKIPDSLPLWLTHILDRLHIYQTSFSKYGAAYMQMISKMSDLKGADYCA